MTDWCSGFYFFFFLLHFRLVPRYGFQASVHGHYWSCFVSRSIAGQAFAIWDMWAFNLRFDSMPMQNMVHSNQFYGTEYSIFRASGVVDKKETGEGNLVSSVNFIKGPGVSEAAIPHFVHHLLCVSLISTGRACPHREDRSPPYTLLMLLSKLPLTAAEKLSRPSTFAAQGASSDLNESRVSKKQERFPIDFHTSVQAACRRLSVQLTLNRKWSYAWTISWAMVSSK